MPDDAGGQQGQAHAGADGQHAGADGQHAGAAAPSLKHSGSAASLKRRGNCFTIGVAGGTASGKTTVCTRIMDRLHDQCVALIHQDSFYRGLTAEELRDVKTYNFDHPDAFDHEALLQCVADLKAGRSVEVPVYDFARHARSEEVRKVDPADVIIVEGILVLHVPELRDLCNMKIYVDTDDDIRLARRIQRDVASRGRDINNVIEQYTKFVKPAFDMFVAPSRRYADVIVPWQRGDNIVAIDLVTEHIKTKLQQHSLRRIYPNLEVIPSNYQIRGMHTIIRDASTPKNDFTFFADRLNRLVVEAGLGLLPFSEKTILTPTGHHYVGVEFARKLCGVSIIRSGESMEAALRTCCKGIKIGKILVVRHHGQMSRTGTHALSPRSRTATPRPDRAAANGPALAPGGSSSLKQQHQHQHQQPAGASPPSGSAAGAVVGGQRQPQQQHQQHQQPSPAAAGAAPPGSNDGSSSLQPGASPGAAAAAGAGDGQQQQQQQQPPGFHSTEGGAFAAAAATYGSASLGHAWLSTSQDDVIYEKLPADIADRHVLLMDPVLSTGNSAARAIEVLLDRGVQEGKIILLCIIAAPEGVCRVCSRFPQLRVVTSEIDDHVDANFSVVPGCGEFGDRYFCD